MGWSAIGTVLSLVLLLLGLLICSNPLVFFRQRVVGKALGAVISAVAPLTLWAAWTPAILLEWRLWFGVGLLFFGYISTDDID